MKLTLLISIALFTVQVSAKTLSTAEITKKFTAIVVPQNKAHTTQSPIPNLYQIISGGEVFYASKDGKHIFSGGLHSFDHELENKSDLALRKYHVKQLDKNDDLISFKAINEKHVVYVFTDPTCGFCRKLHYSLAKYNRRGITVKYIPWPRGGEYLNNGLTNPTFEKFRNALCSRNKKKMVNNLFYKGKAQNNKNCSADKLRNYIQVGKDIGVNVTPIIIDASGHFMPGFKEPDQLLQILKSNS